MNHTTFRRVISFGEGAIHYSSYGSYSSLSMYRVTRMIMCIFSTQLDAVENERHSVVVALGMHLLLSTLQEDNPSRADDMP
jgi:hypothetical protein